MSVKIDKKAHRTLTLFLSSCRSTVGDKVIDAFSSYKGEFPIDFHEILGELSWIIDWTLTGRAGEKPDNVFYNIIEYAKRESIRVLSPNDICIFFGGEDHLITAKNSCLVYGDLTQEQKIAGHLTIPVIITEISDNNISGEIVYNNLPVRNLVNIFEDVKVGDIVLIHFSTIVMSKPSKSLLEILEKMQDLFIINELSKVSEISYSTTSAQAKAKIDKYFKET
jgi:hydrogenase maturation factor